MLVSIAEREQTRHVGQDGQGHLVIFDFRNAVKAHYNINLYYSGGFWQSVFDFDKWPNDQMTAQHGVTKRDSLGEISLTHRGAVFIFLKMWFLMRENCSAERIFLLGGGVNSIKFKDYKIIGYKILWFGKIFTICCFPIRPRINRIHTDCF